jgi:PAS domain S-box-containing protein
MEQRAGRSMLGVRTSGQTPTSGRSQKSDDAAMWFASIVDSSNDAIIGKTLSGTVTAWNRAAEVMFGYSAREMINQSITRIIPKDRMDEEAQIISRMRRNEKVEHFETIRRRKDGSTISVSISASPVRNRSGKLIGISKIARDCSERDERERKLVKTINQLEAAEGSARLAIDGAKLGLMTIYPLLNMVDLDVRAKAMFGLHSVAPIGDDTFLAALHPQSRAQWLAVREAEYMRGEFAFEFRVEENRNERFLTVTGRSFLDQPARDYVRCVVADTTAIHTRRLSEQIQRDRDAAVEASAAKSRFLAAASHDLRQPLHAVGIFLATLESEPLPEPAKIIVDQIAVAITSMQRMLNGLLDVVRLDAGVMTARPETFSLQKVFDWLHPTFEAIAKAKGLSLRIHPSPATVTADRVMLQSVLQNLVSNAINYTDRGQILVEARETLHAVKIEVCDTGCGIPPDRLEDVFGEFVRINRGGESETGMGLGLSIVRRQVIEMGATIDVRSELQAGSTFTLTLPRPLYPIEPVAKIEQVVGSPLSGKCILVVEDHKMVLAGMVMQVRRWGARAVPAASAAEAMSLLALMAPELPDAAVIDLDLGAGASGIALLENIRTTYSLALPAIVVTGSTTMEILQLLKAGGYRWLTKPTEPGALRTALAAALSAAQATGSTESS